jgi:hypothetical protein
MFPGAAFLRLVSEVRKADKGPEQDDRAADNVGPADEIHQAVVSHRPIMQLKVA